MLTFLIWNYLKIAAWCVLLGFIHFYIFAALVWQKNFVSMFKPLAVKLYFTFMSLLWLFLFKSLGISHEIKCCIYWYSAMVTTISCTSKLVGYKKNKKGKKCFSLNQQHLVTNAIFYNMTYLIDKILYFINTKAAEALHKMPRCSVTVDESSEIIQLAFIWWCFLTPHQHPEEPSSLWSVEKITSFILLYIQKMHKKQVRL